MRANSCLFELKTFLAVPVLFALAAGSHCFAQTPPPNLVVDSLTGEVTSHEVDTFIGYTTPLVAPTAVNGDDMSYGTSGNTLESFNFMYRLTGDIPSMSVEHMQLLNLAIKWTDDFILLRNDQPLGPHRVMWTGNVEPVWTTKPATASNAGYAGSETGDMAGHIAFTALNILQTPAIWTQTVPDGDPHKFGATYLARANTYVAMMETSTQNYFTKRFINPTTFVVTPPTSPAWIAMGENMSAWNRQFLFTYVYLRLAQCHAILGDNAALQALYTNVVKVSSNAFVANAISVTGFNGQAAYDWGYGNEGDIEGQITGESSSHASYSMQSLPRIFEAGPAYSSVTLEQMERYANTINSVLWNQGAGTSAGYYKSIDSGLPPLPTPPPATQDYLYPEFYVLTPYNTGFWAAAATAASPAIHNNYHNNPYMTEGILEAKHWVFNHPSNLIAVASNTQSVANGGTAKYTITTASTTSVALSLTGLPAGATASLSASSITAGSGSTLTVSTTAAMLPGSSMFTLTGTSGSSAQNLPLSLVVTAPDFTISAPPGSQSTTSGGTATVTLTVAPIDGFTGDVTLSNDLLPTGVTTQLSPTAIAGGAGSSIVSIMTDATTPGGESPYAITATSGGLVHTIYLRLYVTAVAQTISFPPLGNVAYGAGPIPLQATVSSNVPVAYTVSGPAKLTGGNTLLGYSLVLTGIGKVTVTATEAASKYYTAATPVARTFTVSPGVLTVAATNQSKVYNAALPTLTYTTTGLASGDPASVVSGAPTLSTTATAASAPGVYPITIGIGTLAAANYTFNLVNGKLTVTQAATTTSLAVAPATLLAGASETFTAVVKSGAGAPTGTVSFMNGATALGTGALNAQGVAVFTTTTLPGGTYAVTAVYSGDANFATSTSAATAVNVQDFAITASPASLTIQRGKTGTVALTVTPLGNYKGIVTLSCGTLPADVNCVFSNITATLDGTGAPMNVSLAIFTNGYLSEARSLTQPGLGTARAGMLLFPALLAGLALFLQRRRFAQNVRAQRLLVLIVLLAGAAGLSACGTGTALAKAGTATITVTGAGTLTESTPIAVTIQ